MIYHDRTTPDGAAYGSLDDLAVTVDRAVESLAFYRDEFDSIVVTGMSGVVVGVPVALALDKPVVILRKRGDNAHDVEGYSEELHPDKYFINIKNIGERVCFLDDFECTGETRYHVEEMLVKTPARVAVSYLYRDDDLVPHSLTARGRTP